MAESDVASTMSRVSRPALALASILVAAGCLGAAFFLGTLVADPDEVTAPLPVEAAPPVFADVVAREVASVRTFECSYEASTALAVRPDLPADAERLVVDRVDVAIGDEVGSGAALGVVSGRPLILLGMTVPLARSLEIGDRNADVAKLAKALADAKLLQAGDVGDLFTERIAEGVARLYRANDAIAARAAVPEDPAPSEEEGGDADAPPEPNPPPLGSRVEMSEIVAVPGPLIVTGIPRVGQVLSEGDEPAFALSDGRGEVVGRVDVEVRASLDKGDSIDVRVPGGDAPVQGSVTAISDFREPDDRRPAPGHDLRIALTGRTPSFEDDQALACATTQSTSEDTLAVPTVALRQDGEGRYVLLRESGSDRVARVSVQILAQADGWAAVTGATDLTAGDEVQLIP